MDKRTPDLIMAQPPNKKLLQSTNFSAGQRPPSAALSSSSNSCLGASHGTNAFRQAAAATPAATVESKQRLVLVDAVYIQKLNKAASSNGNIKDNGSYTSSRALSKPLQHVNCARRAHTAAQPNQQPILRVLRWEA